MVSQHTVGSPDMVAQKYSSACYMGGLGNKTVSWSCPLNLRGAGWQEKGRWGKARYKDLWAVTIPYQDSHQGHPRASSPHSTGDCRAWVPRQGYDTHLCSQGLPHSGIFQKSFYINSWIFRKVFAIEEKSFYLGDFAIDVETKFTSPGNRHGPDSRAG